jgi:hypothetical protein
MAWSEVVVAGLLYGAGDSIMVMWPRTEAGLRASNDVAAMLMVVTRRLRVMMENML